jgi:hypothetical protein
MNHGAVDDPASHRLEKLGVRKKIRIGGNIRINNLSMSSVDQLMDVSRCVQCAAVAPIGILFRLKIGLEDGIGQVEPLLHKVSPQHDRKPNRAATVSSLRVVRLTRACNSDQGTTWFISSKTTPA